MRKAEDIISKLAFMWYRNQFPGEPSSDEHKIVDLTCALIPNPKIFNIR